MSDHGEHFGSCSRIRGWQLVDVFADGRARFARAQYYSPGL